MRPLDDLIPEALKRAHRDRTGAHQPREQPDEPGRNPSSLRPTLQVFAQLTNNGLTGDAYAARRRSARVEYLAGGYGNLLAQIFRRNYPNYSAGFSLNIPLRNRAAQADYATSLLESARTS